jgi:hypothetical protein
VSAHVDRPVQGPPAQRLRGDREPLNASGEGERRQAAQDEYEQRGDHCEPEDLSAQPAHRAQDDVGRILAEQDPTEAAVLPVAARKRERTEHLLLRPELPARQGARLRPVAQIDPREIRTAVTQGQLRRVPRGVDDPPVLREQDQLTDVTGPRIARARIHQGHDFLDVEHGLQDALECSGSVVDPDADLNGVDARAPVDGDVPDEHSVRLRVLPPILVVLPVVRRRCAQRDIRAVAIRDEDLAEHGVAGLAPQAIEPDLQVLREIVLEQPRHEWSRRAADRRLPLRVVQIDDGPARRTQLRESRIRGVQRTQQEGISPVGLPLGRPNADRAIDLVHQRRGLGGRRPLDGFTQATLCVRRAVQADGPDQSRRQDQRKDQLRRNTQRERLRSAHAGASGSLRDRREVPTSCATRPTPPRNRAALRRAPAPCLQPVF